MDDIIRELLGIRHIRFNTYSKYTSGGYLTSPESDAISYGELNRVEPKNINDWDPNDLYITSAYWEGSDYVGDTVELSNYNCMLDTYKDTKGIYRVYGGYGTFSVAISVGWMISDECPYTDDIMDTIRELSEYPLISEDDLSKLECDLEYEYVTTDGFKYDFNRAMKEKWGIEILDYNKESAWMLYRDLAEKTNTHPEYESNHWPYIDWDRIVAGYRYGDLSRYDIPHALVDA